MNNETYEALKEIIYYAKLEPKLALTLKDYFKQVEDWIDEVKNEMEANEK